VEFQMDDGVDAVRGGTQVVDFDHTDPEKAQHIYERLAVDRERCPVVHGDKYGGFWGLTRYEDVTRAARDYKHFTSRLGVSIPPLGLSVPSVPQQMDPPEHRDYRRVLMAHFTPQALEVLEPRIRELVVERLETFVRNGAADLVAELAAPIPCAVIALILGLDRENWPQFTAWLKGMESAALAGDLTQRDSFAAELAAFLTNELRLRREQPRNDLLTEIATFELGDAPIPDDIRLGMAQLILSAGHRTTVNGIANLFLHLLNNPELFDRLADEIENVELVDKVIAESLRYEAPVFSLARTVTEEISIHDTTMCPGDHVLVMFGAANRDPRQFEDPDHFDVERANARTHLAFGYGPHRCVGEFLALLEMRIVLTELLQRVPRFALAPEATVEIRTANIRGPKRLDVVWEAAPQ